MKREVSLEEISDGKLYNHRDLVKIDANDCEGCSGCCRGMDKTIILDPMDIYRLQKNLNKSFDELMQNVVELNVVDGLILPNLKMQEDSDACIFLNGEGRCSIHGFRPGFCRLFPLGRYYEEEAFYYINQIYECRQPGRTKIRISKWLQQEDLKNYESFCMEWHRMQKEAQAICENLEVEQQQAVCMYLLQQFYITPYDVEQDFYTQILIRFANVRATLSAFSGAKM